MPKISRKTKSKPGATRFGALPEWDLSALYSGLDDPAIKRDLDRTDADCSAFEQAYKGKLAGLAAAPQGGAALGEAVRRYEAISDRMGRLGSYAVLIHEGNTVDPAITKLNPGVKLPDTAIAVVHRSDGSGTTFIWTNYLSKVSPEWKDKVGENTAVEWPVGIGAKGSEGVANNTANTVGALGYVEYAYAKQNNLTYAKMVNHAGKVVAPTAESFLAAAASADWANAQDFRVIITDAPGEKSWPVAGSTFILMQTVPTDIASSSEALKFFDWGYKNGKQMAADLDYVPMPDAVVALIEKTWKDKIKGSDGKPVY